MDNLLSVMNRLMKVFAQANVPSIQLPRIAVVGAQSAGKSSVLEALVGRDFLPRGSGIVTRRPLVLHLINEPSLSPTQEYGEFGHLPGKRYTDFNDIRTQIDKATDDEAGTGKAVSNKPIFLTIHSPTVVNLILVDLPGLTKVAVGDQPKDIEKQILAMLEEYIKPENTIILAVSAGNVDLANSDALKLAHKHDPDGHRTLGVITKLDLLDQGTDAADYLNNQVIPLRLGYVGLCLRSQKDINENKSMKNAIEDEEKFFRNHPAYATIASRCGTRYLGQTMSDLLIKHVAKTLPQTRVQIANQLAQVERDLARFGKAPELEGGNQAFMLRAITEFSQRYSTSLEGDVNTGNESKDKASLRGGARLNHVFKESYVTDLLEAKIDLEMNDDQLQIQIRNSFGVNSTLFVPEKCFLQLSSRQIDRFRLPALRCVEKSHYECITLVRQSLGQVDGLTRFPQLRARMMDETQMFLNQLKEKTLQHVTKLIEIEGSFVNVDHPKFNPLKVVETVLKRLEPEVPEPEAQPQQQGQAQPANPAERGRPGQPPPNPKQPQQQPQPQEEEFDEVGIFIRTLTAQDKTKTEIVKKLVEKYYKVVRANVADSIPKAVMFFLVQASRQQMQSELMKRLYRDDLIKSLMKEDEGIALQRKNALERQKVLHEAEMILEDISFTAGVPLSGGGMGGGRAPPRGGYGRPPPGGSNADTYFPK
ncbi:putative Vacuolar protein sorting-associated protein 1 [Blattamonas nauphoetae]|uniref:Vacuolar protein sorting-associated protein 1 n=1 Tax=Blattamonas nauphoetae TaxID=2049346 RepID=A0ABQ9XZZ2_9EUKA|nr:putative Vacuolar protein sorting-associated protein 1 [Blattamonas nauphoetae]